jgi:hypothetical protein
MLGHPSIVWEYLSHYTLYKSALYMPGRPPKGSALEVHEVTAPERECDRKWRERENETSRSQEQSKISQARRETLQNEVFRREERMRTLTAAGKLREI